MSGAELVALAGVGASIYGASQKPDKPDDPEPAVIPATEVDVEPTREATRKKYGKSAAANTLLTDEFLEPPTLLKPGL